MKIRRPKHIVSEGTYRWNDQTNCYSYTQDQKPCDDKERVKSVEAYERAMKGVS